MIGEENGKLLVKLWREHEIVEFSNIISIPLNKWLFLVVRYKNNLLNVMKQYLRQSAA